MIQASKDTDCQGAAHPFLLRETTDKCRAQQMASCTPPAHPGFLLFAAQGRSRPPCSLVRVATVARRPGGTPGHGCVPAALLPLAPRSASGHCGRLGKGEECGPRRELAASPFCLEGKNKVIPSPAISWEGSGFLGGKSLPLCLGALGLVLKALHIEHPL